jgi:ketoreductase RED2
VTTLPVPAAAPRVAIVTGSVGGIGRAIALELDRRGYSVLVHGVVQYQEGARLIATLRDARYIDADVSQPESAPAIIGAALGHWGRLDVLVNNAGIGEPIPHADLTAVTPEFFTKVLGVNLLGPWFLAQAAQEALAQTSGTIVNIASIAGLTTTGSSIPYNVSKAGLIHLTRLLAVAMGPTVRVNAVAPGYVETDRTKDWLAVRGKVEHDSPLQRLGLPHDVAVAVLAMIDSSYSTGAVLTVDGGLSLV